MYYNAVDCPWGPQLYGGNAWPTTTTPAGFGAPDINQPKRFIDHYSMVNADPRSPRYSGNYFTRDGATVGEIMSWRYPAALHRPYLFETVTPGSAAAGRGEPIGNALDQPAAYGDPAKNGGRNTWQTSNGVGAPVWIDLPDVCGVVFPGSLVGSAVTDPNSSDAAHAWYMNSGVNAVCAHGITVPNVPNIAGPVATKRFPVFIIYDPDVLEANVGKVGYQVEPFSTIDLESTYGVVTGRKSTLTFGSLGGMYFHAPSRKLYVYAPQADHSREPGNPNVMEGLVHVFHVKQA
jgi:hypothetical protein